MGPTISESNWHSSNSPHIMMTSHENYFNIIDSQPSANARCQRSHCYSNIQMSVSGVSSPVLKLSCSDQLTVMASVWHCLTSASSFWQMGHCWMLSMLATAVGGKMCLWDSKVMDLKSHSNSCSSLLIIGIYPATSAQGHIFMSPHYKIITSQQIIKRWQKICIKVTPFSLCLLVNSDMESLTER